jgi:hypothetical protein
MPDKTDESGFGGYDRARVGTFYYFDFQKCPYLATDKTDKTVFKSYIHKLTILTLLHFMATMFHRGLKYRGTDGTHRTNEW